jgi:hypothetical protein
MVYGGILAAIGATMVALSLGEMASMCVCILLTSALPLKLLTSYASGTPLLGRNTVGLPILLLSLLDFGV